MGSVARIDVDGFEGLRLSSGEGGLCRVGRRPAARRRLRRGLPRRPDHAPPIDAGICLEPMTAPTDALRSGGRLAFVEPGESCVARFSITVERDG